MIFFKLFNRKKKREKVLLLHGPGEKCPCSEKMFGLCDKTGSYAMYGSVFFSLAKSADKPSAAGLALHAVRLIPRVVFALIRIVL